jgi:hypothetical protein
LEENPNNPGILEAKTVLKNNEETDPLKHVNKLPPEWRPKPEACVKPNPGEGWQEFLKRRRHEINCQEDWEKLPFNIPKSDPILT